MSKKRWLMSWVVVLLSSIGQVSAQDLLEQRITLQVQQMRLEDVLKQLEVQNNLHFSYSANVIPLDHKVTVNQQEQKLKTVLKEVLDGLTIEYKQVNQQVILYQRKSISQDTYTISGYVRNALNGEELTGATVFVEELATGAITNHYGFFSLSLPKGTYHLAISYLGFVTQRVAIDLEASIQQNISLVETKTELKEYVKKAKARNSSITRLDIGKIGISINQVRDMPALMGEVDILKSVQMLPGVKTLGEGGSGFFVRGGGMDQNLILLDEAPVYNPSHLFGFFSVFNPDAIRDMELYKGGIPAQYGGRLSSLLDIRMREGNNQELKVTGGVGLISSRLTVEGPVKKGVSSFIVSARRTYADLFLLTGVDPELKDTRLFFYDLNAKFNHRFNDKNRLYISSYFGRDRDFEPGNFDNGWGNTTATIRWNHLFNNRLFSNITGIYSQYSYHLDVPKAGEQARWEAELEDYNLKADFTYYPNPNNTLRFGVNSIYHRFFPGQNDQINVPSRFTFEHAAYASHQKQWGTRWALEYGLRYVLFQNVGSATEYQYDVNHEVVDSMTYGAGKIYHTNGGLEPRANLRYLLSSKSSLKATYNRTFQYLHLLSNSTTSFSSFDIWMPSGPNLEPQRADQLAIGYFRTIPQHDLEFSIEGYYKEMENQVDYRDHAQLLQNPFIERELRFGRAWAYGVELQLKKVAGDLTGFVSYTWSKVFRKIEGVNQNKQYPAIYDRPHDVSLMLNYKRNKRWSFSASWVYTSGRAFTAPVGYFDYQGRVIPLFSERNGSRFPDYHRLDLSAQLKRKEKAVRRHEGAWVFSIYNAYFRKNAFAINFGRGVTRDGFFTEPDSPTAERITNTKLYLFGLIPAVTYNFKF